ncbi:MAG: DMT family transporter [candidate division Zixibacteria bacterium]|nr:DMT family transporter [candidate division Zixibacteria bacterium]
MIKRARYKSPLANIGLFYTAAVWGSTFFLVKQSLISINPVVLVAYRFIIAAIILAGVLIYQKKTLFKHLKEGLILGFFIWVLYIAQTLGLKITTAANSGLITGFFVAFVPLFSILFFKKKPALTGIIATIVSLTGLLVLTGGLKNVNTGDIITLLSAMAYAIHILFADRYVKNGLDPYILNFQQFLFVGLASLLTGLIFKLPFTVADINVIWVILFLALFPTLSAFVIQLAAQRFTAPITVSLILAFEPVFAVIFAWTLGREYYETSKAIGGFLIFLALVISALPSRRLGNKN